MPKPNSYNKEWQKRNREKMRLNYKRYYERHKIERLEAQKKRKQKVRIILISKLGNICKVCGILEPIVFHRKDFKPHNNLSLKQAEKEWKKFIPLCYNCHKTLHRFEKYKKQFEMILNEKEAK